LPVIGFLRSSAAAGSAHLVAAFRKGLAEAGFVEGQNVAIEYRWANDQPDRLPGLAADLVRRGVAAIVGNTPAALAAKKATTSIPIVFVMGSDPVRLGLVSSLNRPGGNLTGLVFITTDLIGKRLGLLHELVPKADIIAVFLEPNSPEIELQMKNTEEAGRAIGRKILIVKVANEREIEAAFATIVRAGAGALAAGGPPLFLTQRRQFAALAARHGLPAIYSQREYVEAGGLMSYGTNQPDAYRRAGGYVARILKGEKPADLPVELASRFEFIINLPTAKALGLEIPPMLLARADEVIE
jgi:putative ABC transport system substrate-binding protein